VFGGGAGDADLPAVVGRLAAQTGRVIVDGWPTGVACVDAMHHGGPWPATSRPEATSVGAHALDRFTRPVSFQGVPDAALPPALQDANPWGLPLTPTHPREH
jgi:NADP-dependent aldehyde dehydrogenase